MREFILRATPPDPARIEFIELEREGDGKAGRVKVRLVDVGMEAEANVDFNVYVEEASKLALLLDEVALEWKGWEGAKEWAALESPFRLVFVHDTIGRVDVKATLGSGWYGSRWSATVEFAVEPGAFERLAKEAHRFLDGQPKVERNE
jgi:hypothetical protein